MRSFTWRYEVQSRGTRKVSVQSIRFVSLFVYLCVSVHSARIGFCADTEVPSLGNVMSLAESKKSLHSSRLMYKQNTRGAHRFGEQDRVEFANCFEFLFLPAFLGIGLGIVCTLSSARLYANQTACAD